MNPLQSSEARGRVGGTIYNTWRGTRYAKQQTSPAQPRTQLQLQIRAWTTYLVRLWATITALQRSNWTDYATSHPEIDWTNSPKRLTGLNWYVRCNLRLLQNDLPIVPDPPATAAPAPPEAFAAAGGVLQSILTWTPDAGTDIIAEIWAFGPHSAGVAAKIQRASRTAAAPGESGTKTITNLSPGTYTFWARFTDENNGLASTWVSATAVITAA
jgi:hypothetical protein